MTFSSRLHDLHQRDGPRTNIAKTIVISSSPQKVLGQIQQIDKDTRDHTKLRGRETNKDMTTRQSRALDRDTKHERLNPTKDALSQSTIKKQVRGSLRGTTKTVRVESITKRDQAISGIQDAVCDLPGKINSRSVQRAEIKLSPRGGPIQRAILRRKLFLTVWRDKVGRQEIQVSRLSGHRRGQGRLMRVS